MLCFLFIWIIHTLVYVWVWVCELALIYLTHDYYNYHHVLQNSSYMPLWIFLSCTRTTLKVVFHIILVRITSYKFVASYIPSFLKNNTLYLIYHSYFCYTEHSVKEDKFRLKHENLFYCMRDRENYSFFNFIDFFEISLKASFHLKFITPHVTYRWIFY